MNAVINIRNINKTALGFVIPVKITRKLNIKPGEYKAEFKKEGDNDQITIKLEKLWKEENE